MAGVTLKPPEFAGGVDEDVNIFTRKFQGFLAGININATVIADRVRALGILRSCLTKDAGEWFDENILGKNWMLTNIYDNTTTNTTANLQALTMAQMNGTNSFRLHSSGAVFANRLGNNAVTVGDLVARMLPPRAFEEDWTNSGGEPTDEAPRFAGNTAGNLPIILPGIHLGQVIFYLKNHYPTVLEERRKVQFGNLDQGNDPVKTFYEKVKRYGRLLNFGDEVITHQFFRGLSPDNQLEVERIGSEKPVTELVKNLEKVEKRKSEMKLGLSKRTGGIDYQAQAQPTSHKPSGFSPEDVDRIVKEATEKITQKFQVQIQELQAKIPSTSAQPFTNPDQNNSTPIRDPIAPPSTLQTEEHHSDYKTNKFLYDLGLVDSNTWNRLYPNEPFQRAHSRAKIANRIAERLEQRELDKEIASLSNRINTLNINDPDAMDTNLTHGIETATDDDYEYTLQVVRKKK
jgi:hypothetical protein